MGCKELDLAAAVRLLIRCENICAENDYVITAEKMVSEEEKILSDDACAAMDIWEELADIEPEIRSFIKKEKNWFFGSF